MDSSILKRAGEFLQEKSRRRRWQKVVIVLATLVIFVTVWVLLMPASALVKKTYCGMEEHTHEETCYELVLVCGYGEELPMETDEGAAPGEGGWQPDVQTPETGGEPEQTPHSHSDACYVQERQLICGQEESLHAHTDACYNVTVTESVICGQEESQGHAHTDACYTDSRELTCGQEESEEHAHEDACYTERHELTCGQEETQGHTHTDQCRSAEENRELVCGQEEGAPEAGSHVHAEDCYQTTQVLTCGMEEQENRPTEGDGAADSTGETEPADGVMPTGTAENDTRSADTAENDTTSADAAGNAGSQGNEENETSAEGTPRDEEKSMDGEQPIDGEQLTDGEQSADGGISGDETQTADEETHIHTEECYELRPVCGYEEHTHEGLCYEVPFCGITAHTHEPDCFDEEGNQTCGIEEHRHTDECYREPHCGITAHVHGDECFDEEGNQTCGQEEHLHTKLCYFETPHYYCVDRMHTHTQECMDENGSVACGYANFVVHTHDEECYLATSSLLGVGEDALDESIFADLTPEENLLCTLPEIEAHTHSEECYVQNEETGEMDLVCEKQEIELHEHTKECYDVERNLICGKTQVLEHHHFEECYEELEEVEEIVKTVECDRFRVVAVYTTKAQIPEEAELRAEEITEESDEERYALREAEYQEIMGSKNVSMHALLKIGFYVGDTEVEPAEGESVTITVQFLDENGLEEGSPITVVHFGKEETEVLEGSDAQDGGTTFEMNSFSEIAIGYTNLKEPDEIRARISKTCEYDDVYYHAVFRIDGEVTIPAELLTAVSDETGDIVSGGDAWKPGEEGERTTAEDGTVILTLAEEEFPGTFEFKVELLDENAEAYRMAAAAYGEDPEETKLYLNQVLSYYLTYNGVKLDLTGNEVTLEVTPAPALIDYAEETIAVTPDGEEEIQAEVTFSLINISGETDQNGSDGQDEETETSGDEEEPDADVDEEMQQEEEPETDMAGEILAAATVSRASAAQPMRATVRAAGTDNAVGARVESQANPKFTVEFYANIDRLVESHPTIKAVTVIDTSGKKMPTNGGTLTKKNIYISPIDGTETGGTVQTQKVLTEVYSPGEYYYIDAPNLNYFNKIAKNDNYRLKEIHVQRQGGSAWEIYSCEDGKEWHFTNRQETQESNDDFILITAGATIRLVHDVAEKEVRNGAAFYDYDVSDGKVYTDVNNTLSAVDDVTRAQVTTHNSGAVWYMYTNKQGINDNGSNQTLAFGNSEGTLKTTLGEIEGNRANAKNAAYGSPTFGLVTGLQDGKLQYKSGVVAPNLFNDGDAKGKYTYAGDLVFRQSGDTYTLIGAEVKEDGKVVSSVMGVDKFTRQRENWNKTYYFAGNDFYPMDGVSSAGTGGHDLMFGAPDVSLLRSTAKKANIGSDYLSAPASDDGRNHNHYFGMHYTIGFDLVKDYVGPLEYLFYGDDDMWVFLDGPGYSGKLICDIGGVHSSVGEYVDLWDYIERGTEGHYNLTFFYTERGASGSTCWMQFTLPSVSFATTKQDTGELRIEKQVSGETTDEEFGFEVHFYNNSNMVDANILRDSYSYTKYDLETGKAVAKDVLIWNDAKFTLKAGEYIVISLLPEGSWYSISEVGPVTVLPKEPGAPVEWEVSPENPYYPEISQGGTIAGTDGTITGAVTKDATVEIRYNNIQKFELPETGGGGIHLYTIAGALVLTCGAGFLYKKKFRERRV